MRVTLLDIALTMNKEHAFISPPLNLIAMILITAFYAIEFIINIIPKCFHIFCKNNEFIKYDLAVTLMPKFIKERTLELDDQIIWDNCHTYWTINTNKGPTRCKIVKYKEGTGQHHVLFYNDYIKPIKVSVGTSVEKRHRWQLDLFDLHRNGDIKFDQFYSVFLSSEWTSIAHK
eukprot:18783_1